MILDDELKEQLAEYIDLLENDILIKASVGSDELSEDTTALVEELAAMSPKIKVENATLLRTPSFSINRIGEDTGVIFSGLPLGHEFNSLILAMLQVSGRPPKIDDKTIEAIKNLKGTYNFETYMSLTCHNCPDVVQALNIISILNPNVTNVTIDGESFYDELDEKNIMAVPAVYLNGEFFGLGRMTLEEILAKLSSAPTGADLNDKEPYDVLVVGGGPAGASAAIYSARKGIRTGIIVERFGGQVLDTLGIENLIGVKYTEGPKLGANLEEHVKDYDVDIINLQRSKNIIKKDLFEVELENGAILKSKTVIISTGAKWRNVGVPGEQEFKNKGVTYCPHCDGPLFKGKEVAVIGGGNSGIEAAIDLAGIANHVTVFEFMPELKADSVLLNRLNSLTNVTVLKNVQTKEFTGTSKIDGITYVVRDTNEVKHIDVDGIFVQIGLVPNTEWLNDTVEKNKLGEIVIDNHGATNIPGIFAAGDCTDSPYKQIIISMGTGATAALSAFDYLIRN
ncbi:alkyl hydroperoxide reductase subunit F [Clostridium saccharoperbutylacetonicum]|uniref:NADH dehydrogenase AhpF n=1 Tax=Clostridium saccharoperbutylacetonicum N1-4(HMT) TaxID=931276 RepID=M1MNC2_9CLOT|nr:alkyl hydroperoxide reductase subunit F [Clostridium saccharoperbutylacetonicum]AGF57698.1 NADH dehydrogenase AhpF [Clostridium saccharoperbutylacetonicum N1-4(HMT)]NRT61534.1 alkyl hydroperoxide reductase subunit F [Clostridium saccharoperbutylacetonicum]NSB24857.1 alkyl hydroperoxide reductase subunit F [Clostridium saccharoperbutylacetonicum]NSB44227.1 alkyl hydroperoxide reductase subunit F [Clostridium saccharoperbutylacetonicum]